jgi:hypothetical protein
MNLANPADKVKSIRQDHGIKTSDFKRQLPFTGVRQAGYDPAFAFFTSSISGGTMSKRFPTIA